MTVTLMGLETPAGFRHLDPPSKACTIEELNKDHESEVLGFLAQRPLHTVFMASQIRDNGIVSPHNRGSFYGARDSNGELEAVALLGHASLIETRTERSLSEFARLARNCQDTQLIRGERDTVAAFWKYYARPGQEPRLVSREQLLQLCEASPAFEAVDLRRATTEDLDKILAVNAFMALDEGGVSPLQKDPYGFRQRTARRIEQGRIWVWVSDGRLTFKADVVGSTPEVAYLEAVHVHPEERRKGYGLRCLSQLSSILLAGSNGICLTVNEANSKVAALYRKAGYQFHSHYETIYLHE
jgi:uncharacterized protein